MVKKTYLSVILFLFFTNSYSQITQDEFCGKGESWSMEIRNKPWYGNNQFLYDFLDSCGYSPKKNKVFYRVPVKFWIYRRSNKTGGISEKKIKKFMVNLNYYNKINNTGISFYLRPDITYINSDKLHRLKYYMEAPLQTVKRKSKGCINIHIVKNLEKIKKRKSNIEYNGTYNYVSKAIIIRSNVATSSLSHEVGHFFGLAHPHKNCKKGKRKQESVSRTRRVKGVFRSGLNCEINGDALADTPAEPDLTRYSNKKCKYTGWNVHDNWGDKYKPSLDNIMSYTSNRECRTKFTKGQIAVMLKTASDNKFAKKWSTKSKNSEKYDFDYFEPDNSKEMASEIFFNSPQTHTFHKTFSGKKTDFNDETDWLFFEVKSRVRKNIKIKIARAKRNFPEIITTIYNKKGKKIKEVKVKGTAIKTMKIPKLLKGKYYIKIQKVNKTKSISEYKIEVR